LIFENYFENKENIEFSRGLAVSKIKKYLLGVVTLKTGGLQKIFKPVR
jgi:hypothetical protein